MKTLVKTIFSFTILLATSACTQSDLGPSPENNLKTIETGTLNFRYNGTSYSSDFSRLSDSTVIFENTQVSELSKILATKTNLVTYVFPDGSIEYIDTPEEAQAKAAYETSIATKALGPVTYCVAECELFRHTGYGGWSIHQLINHCSGPLAVTETELPNKNNKISSVKVYTRRLPSDNIAPPSNQYSGVLILYQFENYVGYSLVLPFTPGWEEVNISSLKKYPLYPGSSQNWNDEVSSYVFRFN